MIKYSTERKLIKIFSIIIVAFWVIMGLLYLNKVLIKRVSYPLNYKQEIFAVADKYALDKALVFAIVKTESNFDKNALSNRGAKGLMQITDKTAEYVAKMQNIEKYDIFNVETNLSFGCYYLRYLTNKFGNQKTGIVAYNAGEGKVREWLKNSEYSENGVTLNKIPFEESKEYLEKIEKSLSNYKKLYKNILDKG